MFITVILALFLSVIGIFLVYSASRRNFGLELAMKQVIWLGIGIVLALALARSSRRELIRYHWVLYIFGCLLLLLTLLFGVEIRGDRSWLDFGLFHVQSSEMMKPALLLTLAVVSERINRGYLTLSAGLLRLVLLFGLPTGLILLQPDIGTAMVYMGIFVFWLALIGLYRETMLLVLAGLLSSLGIMSRITQFDQPLLLLDSLIPGVLTPSTTVLWLLIGVVVLIFGIIPYVRGKRVTITGFVMIGLGSFLAGRMSLAYLATYQLERLRVFLNPYKAPMRSGYNIIQSQIALGSGGWFGQGYLNGSQSQLGFIPELWTDFVFSVAVEELGLVFGMFLITLFLILVYSAFSTAVLSGDLKGYLVCAGVASFWVIHVVLNLGVCVGLLPVVGLPLPFVSYGGSFMLTNWVMVGLLICLSGGSRASQTLG